MKKILLFISLFFSVLSFSQNGSHTESNPFQENTSEAATETTASNATSSAGGAQELGPGNPGEPVPINQYQFVLISVVILMMITFALENSKKSIKI